MSTGSVSDYTPKFEPDKPDESQKENLPPESPQIAANKTDRVVSEAIGKESKEAHLAASIKPGPPQDRSSEPPSDMPEKAVSDVIAAKSDQTEEEYDERLQKAKEEAWKNVNVELPETEEDWLKIVKVRKTNIEQYKKIDAEELDARPSRVPETVSRKPKITKKEILRNPETKTPSTGKVTISAERTEITYARPVMPKSIWKKKKDFQKACNEVDGFMTNEVLPFVQEIRKASEKNNRIQELRMQFNGLSKIYNEDIKVIKEAVEIEDQIVTVRGHLEQMRAVINEIKALEKLDTLQATVDEMDKFIGNEVNPYAEAITNASGSNKSIQELSTEYNTYFEKYDDFIERTTKEIDKGSAVTDVQILTVKRYIEHMRETIDQIKAQLPHRS